MSRHKQHPQTPPAAGKAKIPQPAQSSSKAESAGDARKTGSQGTWSPDAVRDATQAAGNANRASSSSNRSTNTTTSKESSMSNQNNRSQNNNSANAFAQNAQNAFASMFNVEEATAQARANADAALQSFNTLTNGLNQINQQMVNLSQNLMQMSLAAIQAATSARTLREFADLQNDFAKTSFDTLVSRGTEISEQALKVANDASQPISQRINETMERFGRAA